MSKPFDPVKAAQEIVEAEAKQFKCIVCHASVGEEHCEMIHDHFEDVKRRGWRNVWTDGNGCDPL
jgi:hypothetical protein